MKKVIIDCDPGYDDALALILAIASDKLDIAGITTVAGNQTIDKTFRNAKNICGYLDRSIPVYKGQSKPLVKDLVTAAHIHGKSGLDGVNLESFDENSSREKAVPFIRKTVKKSETPLSIISLAPLTNIANLILSVEDLSESIEEIVLMGGTLSKGNISPLAEFNIYVDPEAAKIVLDSKIKIKMIGLDVTRKTKLKRKNIQLLKDIPGRYSHLGSEVGEALLKTVQKRYGKDWAALHDPVAVAAAIEPSILETEPAKIHLETQGKKTRGMTFRDLREFSKEKPNVELASDIDLEEFSEIFYSNLSSK